VINGYKTRMNLMTNLTPTHNGDSVHQHTLALATSLRGPIRKGHAAIALSILPAEADSGIWFLRTDLEHDRRVIAARWDSVIEARSPFTLSNRYGVTLQGASTLLCALRMSGIDNALIEVGGPQVPSRPSDLESFLELLARAGVQRQSLPRKALRVQQTIEVRDSTGVATLEPARDFRVQLIVPRADADPTAALLETTVVSDLTEPGDSTSIEVPNEGSPLPLRQLMQLPLALRARLINVIGQLSLAGVPLIGHFTGYRSDSDLHHTLLRALMTRITASYLTVDQHRMQRDTEAHDQTRDDNGRPVRPDRKLH